MPPISSLAILTQLQNDIHTTEQQLETLDPGDTDYLFNKMLLESELAELQKSYNIEESYHDGGSETENDTQPSPSEVRNRRPKTSVVTTKGPSTAGFAPYANTSHTGFGGTLASDGPSTESSSRAAVPLWNLPNVGNGDTVPSVSTVPVSEGNSASAASSSPESSFVRPQKRPRDSLGVSNRFGGQPSKSMRTTPSPAPTDTTSPTSQSSFEIPDDPDILALFGGNAMQDLQEMKEEQKEQERVLRERKEQERADAEFARQLMEQDNRTSFQDYSETGSTLPGSSRPGSSAAPRTPSQANSNRNARMRRPTPFEYTSPSVSVDTNGNIQAEGPYSHNTSPSYSRNLSHNSHQPIKNESLAYSRPRNVASADFIDLEDDDYLNQGYTPVPNHPSSDLVEIDASAFGGNNHQSQAGSSAAAPLSTYGNGGGPASSSWSFPGSTFGQSMVSSASNAFNTAYNALPQYNGGSNYNSMPGGFGGSSVYGDDPFGSSDIIDLDALDPSPQYLAQDLFTRHGFNAEDPANQQLLSSYTDRIDYLSHDPTRTAADIKSLLENIRPDEDLPKENREGTPEGMTWPLMEHQKLGLAWMKSMEEGSNRGGILADAMGLGKTIQALALMVSRQSTDRMCKTTLIVCPVALLKQWAREIDTKLKPGHKLKVFTYHGEKRFVKWETLRTYDVVLTTFGE